MYQVLYRKWRPKTFSDVVGQKHVTITLENEIKFNRISHAYLFIGSRGTGKTTCAKILAKSVNCLAPIDGNPCGECDICQQIDSGSVMDIVEMDAASNNGVNDIRSLCDEALFTPAVAKYRVYIIDEVHMLSPGAFNALLKTLEEPPAHVIFILATTESHKIPATITSRCQRFEFHKIQPKEICDRLSYICEQEGYSISEDAAIMIAKLADGAMRDALSILDKCMGEEKNIDAKIVAETVGLTHREKLFDLAWSIINGDSTGVLGIINDLSIGSKNISLICEELVEFFRNVMIMLSIKKPEDVLILSNEELNGLFKIKEKLTLVDVLYIIETLEKAFDRMSRGSNMRIEFEVACVKLCSSKLDVSLESIIRRLEKLEGSTVEKYTDANPIKAKKDSREKEVNKESSQNKASDNNLTKEKSIVNKVESDGDRPIEVKKDFSKTTNSSTQNLNEISENAEIMKQWPEVLAVLKQHSQTIAAAFSGSKAYISGNFVLIDAAKSMAFDMLKKSAQRDKMRIAIQEVTGKVYKLGPYKKASEEVDSLDLLAQNIKDAGINLNID